jgi:ATP-citrate lyase beta-subunit
MPRVKLSEYKAKCLILGDAYNGIAFRDGESSIIPKTGTYVVKVDQGIKKRFKQGLVKVNVSSDEAMKAMDSWGAKGFSQFIVEPYLDHAPESEQYLSLERVREGIRVLHTSEGGVDIEAHPEKVQTYIISGKDDVTRVAEQSGMPEEFLSKLISVFEKDMFGFLEINPLVIIDDAVHLLDAAALVDSSGEFFVRGAWNESDVVKTKAKHESEDRVLELAKTTPASLKLSVINPDGALFFLLSGGGGSIVIADEAEMEGAGKLIANYGEYSGGPSKEETYLYAKEVLSLLLASKAPKKALIIAGGVANFTDVKKTFAGIIDALTEKSEELRRQEVKVFVRRGGPNEAEGLALMKSFLEREGLLGSVHGSEAIITAAVADAIQFIKL